MQNRFIVVDDFYGNPERLVEEALKAIKQEELPRGNYAGVMTKQAYLSPQVRDIFQKLCLEPSINSSTNANGRIRFTVPDDPFKFHIHYDVDMETKWAGVVYLSEDHPKGIEGTAFWRHKKTGLEIAPNTPRALPSTVGRISTICASFSKLKAWMNPSGKKRFPFPTNSTDWFCSGPGCSTPLVPHSVIRWKHPEKYKPCFSATSSDERQR